MFVILLTPSFHVQLSCICYFWYEHFVLFVCLLLVLFMETHSWFITWQLLPSTRHTQSVITVVYHLWSVCVLYCHCVARSHRFPFESLLESPYSIRSCLIVWFCFNCNFFCTWCYYQALEPKKNITCRRVWGSWVGLSLKPQINLNNEMHESWAIVQIFANFEHLV